MVKTCIHPFMKFSPHSAKIHRLFDDFIIIFYLTTANDSSYIAQERQRNIYDLTLWTNNQFQTSLVSTGSANISWVSFLIRRKIWCIMCNKLCYKIQTNKHCDLSSKISKRSFFFFIQKNSHLCSMLRISSSTRFSGICGADGTLDGWSVTVINISRRGIDISL